MEKKLILNSLQLIQFIRDLGFDIVDDAVLNDPQSDFVFEVLKEAFYRCTQKKIQKNIYNLPEFFNMEKHDKSFQKIIEIQEIVNFINKIGIQDFGIQDFLFPEVKRLKKILNEMYYFIIYCQKQEENYEALKSGSVI